MAAVHGRSWLCGGTWGAPSERLIRSYRSGDRQLNRALHTIALSRLRYDPVIRAYADRRRAQGKTDGEITRCLKRHIARQRRQLDENHPATP